ncbi:MAG: SpoIID/LytB domain-containing protein [Deltaproteobacteria bacterium]|nr:SpoIID/LytB domain-containing protein [Deltaproteobacteria bacterium]
MHRCSTIAFTLLLSLVHGAPARPGGHTAYTVRLALFEGRQRVRVQGRQLMLMDGDVRDILLRGRNEPILLSRGRSGIRCDALKSEPRSVLLRAAGAIRIDGRSLVGELEVRAEPAGLLVINRLPLDRYLVGLVGAEMSDSWPLEALKAQAVAARTYFLHRRLAREHAPYDLSASTLDQVYRGIEREGERTRRAVRETAGLVLTHGMLPAEALFHACCGGRTHAAEEVFGQAVAYLVSVEDPDCSACPKRRWKRELPISHLVRKLVAGGWKGKLRELRSGSEGEIVLVGERRSLRLDRRELRRVLGEKEIPSPFFTWRASGDRLLIEGRGSGHGVGLCQWGARGMALRGAGFRDILRRYYPGCEIKRLF